MSGKDIMLKVGEEALLRRWFAGSLWLAYAGMPNPDTYSVAVKWSSGNNSAAYNIFLSTGQTEFALGKGRVRVYSVSPHEIRLRYLK